MRRRRGTSALGSLAVVAVAAVAFATDPSVSAPSPAAATLAPLMPDPAAYVPAPGIRDDDPVEPIELEIVDPSRSAELESWLDD